MKRESLGGFDPVRLVRRPRTILVAAACLVAGTAIGWTIPRDALPPSGAAGNGGVPRGVVTRALGRDVYSPDIRHDAYVRQEQLKLLGMIERQCRATGQHCAEARSLRDSLNED